MPGIPGPAPKPADKRARQNAPTFPTVDLERGSKTRPPRLVGRAKLLPAARRYWDVWSRSPQAAQFIATDWLHLEVVVRLVDDFHRAEDARARKEIAGELRLQAAKLGATPEDRLRLRWRLSENTGVEERAERKAKPASRRADPRLKLVEGGK